MDSHFTSLHFTSLQTTPHHTTPHHRMVSIIIIKHRVLLGLEELYFCFVCFGLCVCVCWFGVSSFIVKRMREEERAPKSKHTLWWKQENKTHPIWLPNSLPSPTCIAPSWIQISLSLFLPPQIYTNIPSSFLTKNLKIRKKKNPHPILISKKLF